MKKQNHEIKYVSFVSYKAFLIIAREREIGRGSEGIYTKYENMQTTMIYMGQNFVKPTRVCLNKETTTTWRVLHIVYTLIKQYIFKV